ncbi:MAG: TetR/AcrR family transcriptional regulator, partial [Spirochaetes bacterium]|nr:TetR/AcrR family transcriptional regulator [Spirochaetota bacterium]
IDQRICQVAGELFFRKGYSAVTTDEIAYRVGISKKTLFKKFPTKKGLFDTVVDLFLSELEGEIEQVWNDPESNCLSKMKGFFVVVANRASRVSRALMEDLSRVVPDTWNRFDSFRRRVFRERMGALLHEAKQEGFLFPDWDVNLLQELLLEIISHTFIPEVIGTFSYPTPQIVEALVNLIFQGVLTEEGRKQFGIFRISNASLVGR